MSWKGEWVVSIIEEPIGKLESRDMVFRMQVAGARIVSVPAVIDHGYRDHHDQKSNSWIFQGVQNCVAPTNLLSEIISLLNLPTSQSLLPCLIIPLE